MADRIEFEPNDDIAGTGVQFNFAKLYYLSLDKIMLKKEEAAINGDIHAWYHALQVIYRRMCFKVNPHALEGKEGEKLSKIGQEIEEKFKIVANGFASLSSIPTYKGNLIFMQSQMISDNLNDIDKKLWYLLDKYKMIFPKFSQLFGLKTYADKLKLNLDEDSEQDD